MASASPTDDRSARESRDRSGVAFESFDGGVKLLAASIQTLRRSRIGRSTRCRVPDETHGR